MKTAISLPEPLFEAAEKLAKRMNLSRSALYARAVEDFVQRYDPDDLTAEQERDPFIATAAANTLRRVEWKE
jgi:predicted transcriptional regulator